MTASERRPSPVLALPAPRPSVARQAVQLLREELRGMDIDARRLYDLHWDARRGSHVAWYTRPNGAAAVLLVLNDTLSAEARAVWAELRAQQVARGEDVGRPGGPGNR